MKRLSLSLASLLFCAPLFAQPALRINEFMASNTGTVSDPDFGETGDWIELFNAGASAVDLSGYGLTDDLTNPHKWTFPAGTSIAAQSFLIVWADDFNTGLHTNFKLSSDGEAVGLFDAAGNGIDSIIFPKQTSGISFGRLRGNATVWRYLAVPTPVVPNAATGYLGFTEPVTYSIAGGFYEGAVSVALASASPSASIHYTTDGSTPTSNSPTYTGAISFPATGVLRAIAFQDDFLPSAIATQTYFINESTTLPVVSLAMNPEHLWSDEEGIYVAGTNGIPGNCVEENRNWNQDWEYPASMEFFESDRSPIINQVVGVKIFGACSRQYDQKSLSVHARNRYGKGKIKYKFFEDRELDEFDSLILRNAGQDWYRTMFRDGMIQTVIAAGIDIDHQAYRPAILFLNGEYFGIHNIREKITADYITNHYGYEEDEFDFLEVNAFPIRGDANHYNEMIDFVSSNDMSRDENLATVNTMMEVDHYLDYLSMEIYIANADWPSGNNKYWRPKTPDGRWRWMIFDTDLSFGSTGRATTNTLAQATDPNGPEWPNPPWSTLLFRSLLDNDHFKDQFIQRIASHTNITFDSTYVRHVIDSLQVKIADEVPRHKARWPESIGFNTPWPIHIQRLIDFNTNRPANLRSHVIEHFELRGSSLLQVNTEGAGTVYVSDVPLRSPAFTGEYFMDIPIELRASPAPGYRFAGWSGAVNATADSVEIQIATPASVQATFEPTGPVSNEPSPAAYRYNLAQNFPNPAGNLTTIPFELAKSSEVSIQVYDLLGRQVQTLVDGNRPAGNHDVQLNTTNLAPGVYVYTLKAGDYEARRKLIVVR